MSEFYDKTMALHNAECHRINEECAAMDADPAKKDAEKYSLLKCRWGAITSFAAPFYNSHRLFAENSDAHYMVPHIWEDLCADVAMYDTFNSYYESADEDLRKDLALLFGYHAYAYRMIREKASALGISDERERLKLREYLLGYRFALDSIRQAWNDTRSIRIEWRTPYSAELMESVMIDTVRSLQAHCRARLASLPDEAKNEKKALNVENGMYSFCLNGGLLAGTSDNRENAIRLKCNRMPRLLSAYPRLAEAFGNADDEEKLCLTALFYGVVWMTYHPLPHYTREYELAKESGDVRAQFEHKIKIDTVTAVIRRWIDLAECFGYAGLAEVPHGR